MVNDEVENILLEIRARVRAQEAPAPAVANSAIENGAGESAPASGGAEVNSAAEALARLDSHLTVTSRTWDRLPPLLSNRSGGIARLELWVKRQIKRATHWFTWEQINFNAAVHHCLRETLLALSASERALEELRAEMKVEIEAQKASHEEKFRAENEVQRTMIERNQAQLKAYRAESEAERNELQARLSELMEQLRERDARMQDEQRVCFKQLSLEATEAAVMEDRARRKTETLLEELSRRVEQLERQS